VQVAGASDERHRRDGGRTWCRLRAGKPALRGRDGIEQLGARRRDCAAAVDLAKDARVGEGGGVVGPAATPDKRGGAREVIIVSGRVR